MECYLYTFLNFIVDIIRDSLSLLLSIWCASIVNELKMLKLQSLASRHWQRRRRRWIFVRFVCVLSIFFATTRPGYFYVLYSTVKNRFALFLQIHYYGYHIINSENISLTATPTFTFFSSFFLKILYEFSSFFPKNEIVISFFSIWIFILTFLLCLFFSGFVLVFICRGCYSAQMGEVHWLSLT